MGRDREIFGLASGESGGDCDSHEIYGHQVAVGDFVKFKVVKLRPLPQHQPRAHIRTDKSKRPESHPTKECARAFVLCLKTEPR
jgi:hypothetical protein